MDFKALTEKVSLQYSKKMPFVIFSLPNSEIINGYCQKNDKLHIDSNLNKNGFVLFPFESNLKSFIILQDNSESYQTSLSFSKINKVAFEISEIENEKKLYKNFIQKTIDAIQTSEIEKIVVSRKKDFKMNNFSIETLISRLFSIYPTAFRYVWYHPKTGIWCGATPEVLVDIKENKFKTMALAGTQPYTEGEVFWRKKELEEQHFVTEAILKNLNGIVSDLKVSETRNQQAGTLLHLCTNISGKLKNERGALSKIARALHPTPAVCGTPQDKAKDFIIKNEPYSREYYTGFLGPIDDDGTSASLMVNLRCMKIENDKASVFVGGGITTDSVPEEEWSETQNKMQTMLQVLHPML